MVFSVVCPVNGKKVELVYGKCIEENCVFWSEKDVVSLGCLAYHKKMFFESKKGFPLNLLMVSKGGRDKDFVFVNKVARLVSKACLVYCGFLFKERKVDVFEKEEIKRFFEKVKCSVVDVKEEDVSLLKGKMMISVKKVDVFKVDVGLYPFKKKLKEAVMAFLFWLEVEGNRLYKESYESFKKIFGLCESLGLNYKNVFFLD